MTIYKDYNIFLKIELLFFKESYKAKIYYNLKFLNLITAAWLAIYLLF
jgi:hypothetical protein